MLRLSITLQLINISADVFLDSSLSDCSALEETTGRFLSSLWCCLQCEPTVKGWSTSICRVELNIGLVCYSSTVTREELRCKRGWQSGTWDNAEWTTLRFNPFPESCCRTRGWLRARWSSIKAPSRFRPSVCLTETRALLRLGPVRLMGAG